MANVIKTVLTYKLDGSNRDFNIPFEYLARKFVVVTLIGVDRKVLTINTDYRFVTRTTISLTKAWGPADGYTTIELRRVTSTTDRLVDFTDGSILRAYDLNVAQIQTMHVAEEARDLTADTIGVNNDGHLDARGRRIVNLANAVDDRDAVPLGQLKTMNQSSWQARNEALQFRNDAETFKNQAEGFKNESSTNSSNTYKWRNEAEGFRNEAEQFNNIATQQATAAGNSAAAANQSEVNSANSATDSANYAALAEQQADRAEREADKLGNMNDFAGAIDSVDTVSHNVTMKGAMLVNDVIQARNPDGWNSIYGDLDVGRNLIVKGRATRNGNTMVTKEDLKKSEFAWNSSLIFPGESEGLNVFRKSGENPLGLKYNGAIEVRPMAGWDETNNLGRSPMITFHWPGKVGEALFMTEYGELAWGDPEGTWNRLSNTRQMSGGNALRGWRVDPANPSVADVWGYAEQVPPNVQVNINIIPDTGFPYTPVGGGVILTQVSTPARAQYTEANTVAWWVQQGSIFAISSGSTVKDNFFWTAKINFQY